MAAMMNPYPPALSCSKSEGSPFQGKVQPTFPSDCHGRVCAKPGCEVHQCCFPRPPDGPSAMDQAASAYTELQGTSCPRPYGVHEAKPSSQSSQSSQSSCQGTQPTSCYLCFVCRSTSRGFVSHSAEEQPCADANECASYAECGEAQPSDSSSVLPGGF